MEVRLRSRPRRGPDIYNGDLVHYGSPAQIWPRPLLPDLGRMLIMEVWARSDPDPAQTAIARHRPDVYNEGPGHIRPRPLLPDLDQICLI